MQEKHRTWRVAIVGAYILVGFLGVVYAAMRVLLHDGNPWVKVVELLLAPLLATSLPAVPLFLTWRKIKVYFADHKNRSQQLEAQMDQNRESSGLDQDGSSPYDPS